jgi:hypothetical protein
MERIRAAVTERGQRSREELIGRQRAPGGGESAAIEGNGGGPAHVGVGEDPSAAVDALADGDRVE